MYILRIYSSNDSRYVEPHYFNKIDNAIAFGNAELRKLAEFYSGKNVDIYKGHQMISITEYYLQYDEDANQEYLMPGLSYSFNFTIEQLKTED